MRLAALLFALVLVAAPSFANGPTMMNYQAVFTDAEGNIMPDGDYVIGFHIYTGPFGGPPIWSEWDSVTVENGVFEVLLGWGHPLQITDFPAAGAWLGLSYDDVYLTPRQFIAAVPYSFYSCFADSTIKLGEHTPASITSFMNAMYDSLAALRARTNNLQIQINEAESDTALRPRSFQQANLNNVDVPLDGVNLTVSSNNIVINSNGSAISFSVSFGGTVNPNFAELCCGEITLGVALVNVATNQTVYSAPATVNAVPGAPIAIGFQSGLNAGTYRIDATISTSVPSGGNVIFVRLAGVTYSGLILEPVAP